MQDKNKQADDTFFGKIIKITEIKEKFKKNIEGSNFKIYRKDMLETFNTKFAALIK
jgi:hypothetical protein